MGVDHDDLLVHQAIQEGEHILALDGRQGRLVAVNGLVEQGPADAVDGVIAGAVGAHVRGGSEVPASTLGKHRTPRPQGLFGGTAQVPAPRDHSAQADVGRVPAVARAAGEQP
jgi:hypothetical protein